VVKGQGVSYVASRVRTSAPTMVALARAVVRLSPHFSRTSKVRPRVSLALTTDSTAYNRSQALSCSCWIEEPSVMMRVIEVDVMDIILDGEKYQEIIGEVLCVGARVSCFLV
jgi:hypothetical protein